MPGRPGGVVNMKTQAMTAESLRHFYTGEDGLYVPGPLVAGPWNPAHQGGVPLAGLCAHLVEQVPTLVPMVTTRLVIDLLRPTPMQPVAARVTVPRDGKRLQMVEAEILADGIVTARVSALRVRVEAGPATPDADDRPGDPPQAPPLLAPRSRLRHLVDSRLVRGGLEERGPGTVWLRISGDIVAGTPISPFVQAAMCADFGSGLSAFVDWRAWSFANVDITLHLVRMPVGPWLKLEAQSLGAGQGMALVDGHLTDAHGPIGRCHQTLYLNRTTTA